MTALLARLAAEPGVVGTSVTGTGDEPLGGFMDPVEAEGVERLPEDVRVSRVDERFFELYDLRVVAGRGFAAADAALPVQERPVIVNRSFVAEILGGGAAVGRRIRYLSRGDSVLPWLSIVGVVEDLPAGFSNPGETGARMYHFETPGESRNGTLAVRLRGQAPEGYFGTLRRIATSVDINLQLSEVSTLDARHREYSRFTAILAIVIAVITGSVLLLSAAGIHALMTFTVNQRRREIGILAALGAPARQIVGSILSRATRQLGIGVVIGLAVAVGLNHLSDDSLMGDTALLLVLMTAAFMLVVGLLAAAGPARRSLRVPPTEALRAD
jgi:hypothetical protein